MEIAFFFFIALVIQFFAGLKFLWISLDTHQVVHLSYVTCCRSHTFIDVTGVETASSFSANTSYKIVDGTVVIDNESFNDHDISDTGTSTSSSEQSDDR